MRQRHGCTLVVVAHQWVVWDRFRVHGACHLPSDNLMPCLGHIVQNRDTDPLLGSAALQTGNTAMVGSYGLGVP